ncbi:MAG TPA: CBS domain-containing protein [Fervidobacterium sp.]|nr:CBS domain-containing protein [Fervidobacterium sp.]HPT54262.1 CBS domain-containing protein [Fervidobacterium sp.]HPZ17296.1 CBS domain-containing protein [Fervidobacterium sp.]HQE48367.1 CBS domain-containing protein [Fervidobacterium sp.]HRD20716.1 CBS domain-containing protein [Fervidobacterium sp.]
MKAVRWVNTFFPIVKNSSTVSEALRQMRKYSSDYCVVIDEDGKFDGLMHKSVIKEVEMEEKVGEYVIFPDFYIVEDSTIEEAAMMLIENKETILPVVNSNSEVIGILGIQEVLEAMTEIAAMDEHGIRINLELQDKPGELRKVIDVLANNKINVLSILTLRDDGSRLVSIKVDSKDAESVAGILEVYEIPYESIIEEEGFF